MSRAMGFAQSGVETVRSVQLETLLAAPARLVPVLLALFAQLVPLLITLARPEAAFSYTSTLWNQEKRNLIWLRTPA